MHRLLATRANASAAFIRLHRAELLTMAALAAATIAVLSTFRREPVFSDDLGYWERWDGRYRRSGMANPHRLVMAFSAEVARWVFGHSMAAYNAVGIAYAVGLIVVIYLLTRLMFPRAVAVAAALLLLTSSVFLQDATLLVPDWASMFWFTAGLLLLVHAARPFLLVSNTTIDGRPTMDESRPQSLGARPAETGTRQNTASPDESADVVAVDDRARPETPWRATALALTAGLLFHLAIFSKEGSLPILLAVPICMLLVTHARRAIKLTAIAAGSTAVFAVVEMGIMWHLYGDPLRRVNVVLGGHVGRRLSERLGGSVQSGAGDSEPATGGEVVAATSTTLADWWALADRYLHPLTSTINGTIVVWLAALTLAIILVAIVAQRSRRLAFFAVLTVIGLGSVVFGVGSINPLVPILSMKFRYLALGWVFLMPLIAAAVWTLGASAAHKVSKESRKIANIAGIGLLVAAIGPPVGLGFYEATQQPIFVRNGADGLSQTARRINELQQQGIQPHRIVADGRTQQGLRIQLRGDDMEMLRSATSNFGSVEPGDLVVVNRKRIGRTGYSGGRDALPESVMIPPANWRYLGEADFADIFIYYIEDVETAPLQSLSTTGNDISGLLRGSQLDGDDAEFGWQREGGGLFLWMQDIRNARIVTGHGSHPRAPSHGDDPIQLAINEPGRFGVRVELHVGAEAEIRGFWLRTYGDDGEIRQNVRLYRVTEEDRVSTPQFTVPLETMEPVSFATSLQVDPAVDRTYRVVGFASGSGIITVDRIATKTIPTN